VLVAMYRTQKNKQSAISLAATLCSQGY